MKNNLLKFISTVLVLSICLTILPSFPALAQESFAQTTVSPDTLEIALQMLETPRLPEEDKPEAVASYLVEQKGHVVRLREKEEDLNTVIFQNRDGNKTMYHFDQPVKYVDKNGNIKDKKTTVTDVIDKAEYSADYGFVTSDNDINTYFPKRLGGNAGVLVEYQDIKIEIIPLSAEKNAAVPARKKQYQVDSETRDSIEYNKAFGNNTLLKYTPTFSGFKEDIILTAYTGRNEFGFKVKTNGLSLVCEDGKYYLADPATEEKLMQVGNIIVYDSSMVPNTTPSETVLNPVKPQPVELTEEERNALYFPEGPLDPVYNHYYRLQSVKENEEYILTIVVDEDYLTCEDTVYPVTVDPSLSLTASGFEDATIYTNYTSNQGASLNMFVGNYTERYGGTKGVARALVKFPGLFSNSTFASLSSNNIISVDFMLRDTMCEGDAVWIDCYRMNQNWSESTAVYSTALWNGYTGTHVDNAYIHYYGGTGSNGTGTGHWYHLDITAVVKEWMNGYYGGRNNHYGIMLKASDETQAAKTFATSDNTSYPPKLIVDYDDGDHGSVAVTSVRFVQDEYVVPVGWSGRIAVTVEPAGASDEFLNWVLFDSAGVSTINYTTGIFTAFAEGTVTLAAGPLSGSTPNSGDVCTIRIVNSSTAGYIPEVISGADVYILDEDVKNTILNYYLLYNAIQDAYYSGQLTLEQKNSQQDAIMYAIDIARADYVVLNPQSDFVYQYFKERNYQSGDLSPFTVESYTYPNDGISGLDVVIIQRALELLAYFEPPDDYIYGEYDQLTHQALLTSPFYMIGSEDFQKYNYYDMFGSSTANMRTKSNVQELHKKRFIHNEVARWVAGKVGGRTQNTTIYHSHDPKKWGFADVMKTTSTYEYIWEVKPWGDKYRVLNSAAALQLSRYIDSWNTVEQPGMPDNTAMPGYDIGKFAFELNGEVVIVESNPAVYPDTRCGLVHYYPVDNAQYRQKYAPDYVLETSPAPVPSISYSYSFDSLVSFGDANVQGVVEVAGKILLVVVVAGVVYYCGPYILPFILTFFASNSAVMA